MDNLLQELINFVNKASPIIWEALIRQVYVDAALNMVWVVAMTIASVLIIKFVIWSYREEFDMYELVAMFGGAVAICTVTVAIACLNGTIGRLLNPEFYAIRYILEKLSGVQ